VASLRRWTIRDALGQALAATLNEMTGGNDNAFRVWLKEPFPLLLDGLAKRSSLVPFIMPERTAKTGPFRQITNTVGSCPFKFVREEFEPGHRAVYVKNADYVARSEAATQDWKPCASFFTCGTPMGAAKRLIAEAGYKGEPIVVLDGVDLRASHAHGLIAADLLKKLRFNVQLASSDWSTVVTRRPRKSRSRKVAGTSLAPIFLGGEMLYSWLNPPLPANGDKAWFGWPKDDEIDALRKAWLNKLNTSDSEVRQEIAAEIQERAFEAVPCIPTGQYWP
jgi:ABC-type transport system substrate-binding protein